MGLHGHERAPKKLLAIGGDQCREHNATGEQGGGGEKDGSGVVGIGLAYETMHAEGMHGHETDDTTELDVKDPLSKQLWVFVGEPDPRKKTEKGTGQSTAVKHVAGVSLGEAGTAAMHDAQERSPP